MLLFFFLAASAASPFFLAPFKRQISVYYLKDDVNTHSFIYFVVADAVVGVRGGAVEKRLIVRELHGGHQCCCCCC